jgi:hypothetical protein
MEKVMVTFFIATLMVPIISGKGDGIKAGEFIRFM